MLKELGGKKEMRMAIFADTHGNHGHMRSVLREAGPFDALLHLGDGIADGEAVARENRIPMLGVYGNEDRVTGYPESSVFDTSWWKVLLMHGHQFDINPYHDSEKKEKTRLQLSDAARTRGAEIFFFGHSHEPLLEEVKGVVLCNPGNQYIGSSSPPTFAVLELAGPEARIALFRQAGESWEEFHEHRASAAGTRGRENIGRREEGRG